MKLLSVLALSATATSVLGASIPVDTRANKFLVELAPGETRWVTEEEKWELKQVCTTLSHTKVVCSLDNIGY